MLSEKSFGLWGAAVCDAFAGTERARSQRPGQEPLQSRVSDNRRWV